MSRIAKPIVWTASLALLAGMAHAAVPEAAEQPYKVILTRNAFNLKPPPPPPPEPPPGDVGPPPNIKLTGIISITSPKKAMFKVEPVKGDPMYLTVNEGEHSDGDLLKVVEIDEQSGSVKIVMNNVTHTLDFEKNGIKNAVASVAPAKPAGLPANPGMAQPGGGGGGTPIQFNSPNSPKPTSTPASPGGAAPSLQPSPTRALRLQSAQPQSQLGPAVPDKPLTVETSVILKRADEMVNKDKIDKGQYPPALPIPELDQ